MKLAVAFAACVSVLGFSSCLDSDDNGPDYKMDNVTITNTMGTPMMMSDVYPGVAYVTDAYDLSVYGIPNGTKRAAIAFTIPEGTDLTQNRIKIDLVSGSCFSLDKLSSVLSAKNDSCKAYTSRVYSLAKKEDTAVSVGYVYYSNITAGNGFLNLAFSYAAEKAGHAVLEENRIGNDTLYVDLRLKADISETAVAKKDWRTFDLSKGRLIYDVVPENATHDSIYITVLAETSQYGRVEKDSLTVFTKAMR